MSYTVRLRIEAEQDITVAASWYEQQQIGLGQKFLDEFMAVRLHLSETPLLYPTVYRNTHRAITNRFPFGVYFRVDHAKIVIVAVMHGSRNPRQWHSRT